MAEQVDIAELARMIKAKRGNNGLRAIAEEIGEISASTLSRVEQGKVPDLDTFIRICKWLGVPTDHFTLKAAPHLITPGSESNSDTIIAHLRADRTLDPKTTEALVIMIQMAYDSIERGEIG